MAATNDVVAVTPDFLDLGFNIDDFDFELAADDLDFDLAADEFCDAYSAFVANADTANNKRVGGGAATGGWLAGPCGDHREGSREGSPESGVTTDGPLLAGDEAMSAYVAELERFMMEDGDVEEASCFCHGRGDGDQRVEELIGADDFFTDDLLASSDSNNGLFKADFQEKVNEGIGVLLAMACRVLESQHRSQQLRIQAPEDASEPAEEE